MSMNNITSANASISITDELGTVDFERFSADSALTPDTVRGVETRQGVDGQMAAGWVPTIKHMTVDFEASSGAIPHLMALANLADTTKTPMAVVMTITVPSVGRKFVCTGFLVEWPPTFSLKRTLDPMQFGFDFSDVVAMNI